MREFMDVTKALADENRVRMLLALRGRELCLCQVVALFRLAASTVSKHLSILKQARLVEARKEGRWMYYRQAEGDDLPPAVRGALEWVQTVLARDPVVREDACRLREILKQDLEEICRTQFRK